MVCKLSFDALSIKFYKLGHSPLQILSVRQTRFYHALVPFSDDKFPCRTYASSRQPRSAARLLREITGLGQISADDDHADADGYAMPSRSRDKRNENIICNQSWRNG